MAITRSKKKLTSNATKAPSKMSLDELCKKIGDHSTRKGEDRKSGASDTVCNHLKMFAKDLNAMNDIIPMLNDYKAIETYLSNKKGRGGGSLSINSLKSYYTSLKLGAEVAGANKDAIEAYTKKMNEYAGISNEAIKENVIPEKFVEDGMPVWDNIKGISSKFTNGSKYGQNHMIVALYTLIPPRRLEYRTMVYLDKKPSKQPVVKPPKARGDKDVDGNPWNYIYPEGDSYKMVIGDYKTNKQYGLYEVKVPEELAKVVKGYINKQNVKNGGYFITKSSGKPYADSAFSRRLTGAFAIKYEKHRLTVDNLRHIYINNLDLNQFSIKEKEDIAKAMGHSVAKQAEYKQVKTKKAKTTQVVEEDATNEAETSAQAEARGEFDDNNDDVPTPHNDPQTDDEAGEPPLINKHGIKSDELVKAMVEYYKVKTEYIRLKMEKLKS